MFTGLVQAVGRVGAIDRSDAGARVVIETPLVSELRAGDSIAVNGVCLSGRDGRRNRVVLGADAMNETLRRSVAGRDLAPARPAAWSCRLRAGDRTGGHVVQGHVDGVGSGGRGRRGRVRPAGRRSPRRTGGDVATSIREGIDRGRRGLADGRGRSA